MVRPTRTFFVLFLSLAIFQITYGRTVKPVPTDTDDSAEDAESRLNLLALTKPRSESLESVIKKCDLSELLTKLRDEMKLMSTSREINYKKDVFSLLADIKNALTDDDDKERVIVEITKPEFSPSEHVKIDVSNVVHFPDQPEVFIQEEANFDVQCDPLQNNDVSNIEDILNMILTEFNQLTNYVVDITTPENFQMFLSELTNIMSFWSNMPKTQLYYILSQHSQSYYIDWINRLLTPTNTHSPLIANFNVQMSLKIKLSTFIARWINKPQQEVINIIATQPNSYICSLLNELLSNLYKADRFHAMPSEDKFLNFKNKLASLISQWTGILYSNVFYKISQITNMKLIQWVYELLQPYNQFTTNTETVPIQVKILLARNIAYLLNTLEQPVFQKLNVQPDYYILTMINKLLQTEGYFTAVVPATPKLDIKVKLTLSEFNQKLLEFLSYCIKPINNMNHNYNLQSFPTSFWDSWVNKLLQNPPFDLGYVPQNSAMGISGGCLVQLSKLISSWTGYDEVQIYNKISQQDNSYLMSIFNELFIYGPNYSSPSIQEQPIYINFEHTPEPYLDLSVVNQPQLMHIPDVGQIPLLKIVEEPENIVKVTEHSTIGHIPNVPSIDVQPDFIDFIEPQQIDFIGFQEEPTVPEIELIPAEEHPHIVQIVKTPERPTMLEISNMEQPGIIQQSEVIHILESPQQTVVQSTNEPTIIKVIEVDEPSQDFVQFVDTPQIPFIQVVGNELSPAGQQQQQTIIEINEVEQPNIVHSPDIVQIEDTIIPIPVAEQQPSLVEFTEFGQPNIEHVPEYVRVVETPVELTPVVEKQPTIVDIYEFEQPNIDQDQQMVLIEVPDVEGQQNFEYVDISQVPSLGQHFVHIPQTTQQTFVQVPDVKGQQNFEYVPVNQVLSLGQHFVYSPQTTEETFIQVPDVEGQQNFEFVPVNQVPSLGQHFVHSPQTSQQTFVQVPDIEGQQNFEFVPVNQVPSIGQHFVHSPQTTQQTFIQVPDVEVQQNFEYVPVNQEPNLGQHLVYIPQTSQQTFVQVPDVEGQQNFEFVPVNQVPSIGQHFVHSPQTTQQTFIQVPDVEVQQNFEYVPVNQEPNLGQHLVYIPQTSQETFVQVPNIEGQQNFEYAPVNQGSSLGQHFVNSPQTTQQTFIQVPDVEGQQNFKYVNRVPSLEHLLYMPQTQQQLFIPVPGAEGQQNVEYVPNLEEYVMVTPTQVNVISEIPHQEVIDIHEIPQLIQYPFGNQNQEITEITVDGFTFILTPENKSKLKAIIEILTGNSNVIDDDICAFFTQYKETPTIGLVYNLLQGNSPLYSDEGLGQAQYPSNLIINGEQPQTVYQPNLVIKGEQSDLMQISEQPQIMQISEYPSDLVTSDDQSNIVQNPGQSQIIYQLPSNILNINEQPNVVQIDEYPQIPDGPSSDLLHIVDEQQDLVQISGQPQNIYQTPSNVLIVDSEQPNIVPGIIYQHPPNLVINDKQPELISEEPEIVYQPNLVINGEQSELKQISEQPQIVQIFEQPETVFQYPSDLDEKQSNIVQIPEQPQIIYQLPSNILNINEQPNVVQIDEYPQIPDGPSSDLLHIVAEQQDLVQISGQPQNIYQTPSNLISVVKEEPNIVQVPGESQIVYQHPLNPFNNVGEQSNIGEVQIFNQPSSNLLNVLNQHSEQDLLNWIQHVLQLDAINGPLNDISATNCEEFTVDGFTFVLTPVNKLKLKRIIEILTGNSNVSESDIHNFLLQYKGSPMIAMIYKLLDTNSSIKSDGEHVIVLKRQLTQLISLLTGIPQNIIYVRLSQTDPSQLPALLNQLIQVSSNRLDLSQNQSLESFVSGCDVLQSLRLIFPEINIQYLNNLILKTITKFLEKLSLNASLASEEISLAVSGEISPELVISNTYPTSSSLLLNKIQQNNIRIPSPVYNWVNRYGNYLRNPVQQIPTSVPNAFKQLFGNQVLI